MAFHYMAGETTFGAADHIAEFFAAFQAWITGVVGWTVAAGGGTKNLRLSSIGEGGTYTMLFTHIWESVAGTLRGEVSDDVAPTHETTENGTIPTDSIQFRYFVLADLDAIMIIVPYRGFHRALYLGIVEPVAAAPPDETYHMVATGLNLSVASILRLHTGAWDQDITNYTADGTNNIRRDPLNDSFSVQPLYADRFANVAGQYKFITNCFNADPSMVPEDEAVGLNGTYKCFQDGSGAFWKWNVRVDGAIQIPPPDGPAFASATGVAPNAANFLGVILPAFLVAIGWTDLGDPGAPDNTNRLFRSPGVSGLDTILINVGHNPGAWDQWTIYAQDDGIPTHQTTQVATPFAPASFPATYFISADRDCLTIIWVDAVAGTRYPQVVGKLWTDGVVPDCTYSMVAWSRGAANSFILRDHEGTWNTGLCYLLRPTAVFAGCNPNSYDGASYVVVPQMIFDRLTLGGGVPYVPIGQAKFLMYTDGGGLVTDVDTITVGAEVYRVFNTTAAEWVALRTV